MLAIPAALLRAMPGRRPLAAAALLLLLLLFAACGDDGGVDGALVPRSPTPGDATPAAATATPEDAPASMSTPAPDPTATPNADGVYVVPCGDVHAPLDKLHRLEADCEPAGLVPLAEAYAYGPQQVIERILPDLLALLEAAAAEGHRLAVVSGYRSYETQRDAFQYHVETYGLEEALRVSARPGHSEHQLGTTVDFSSAAVGHELVQAFGATPEGRWLAERAHEFGFVMSYPPGLESVTGYVYEPWHFRWVGREMATAVRASGLTLGEFLLR